MVSRVGSCLELEKGPKSMDFGSVCCYGAGEFRKDQKMAKWSVGPQYVFAGVPEYKFRNFILACQLETL